ncbi:MAG: carbon-nitrogen hydrolase family protein [Helicobacteraceae bacterium]|jgi:nitrilase|nr:carbon-nitrogen hydrolase family protein [Helicobacteraceae bacterium]
MKRNKTFNVAVLQTDALAIDSARLDYLLAQAKSRGSRIAVLPEYVCNSFFKELAKSPVAVIKKEGAEAYENLAKLAKQYQMTIIAPIVRVIGNKPFKSVYRFAPDRVWRFDQRILIDYSHWNEAAFFANNRAVLKPPTIFTYQGFRICLLFGFELHSDLFWHQIIKKKADVVIAVSVCAFESFARWQTLCKTRSFIGGCYLIRANRVGEYLEKRLNWTFYGNSLYCNPFGEIENSLEDREGILVASCEHSAIREARQAFGFGRIARNLKLLTR